MPLGDIEDKDIRPPSEAARIPVQKEFQSTMGPERMTRLAVIIALIALAVSITGCGYLSDRGRDAMDANASDILASNEITFRRFGLVDSRCWHG